MVSTTTLTTSTPKCFEDLDTESFADQFVLQRTDEIDERGISISMYNHEPTGAHIMLVDAPDQNKCFSCNFRTLPKDNTGVPHILEHSVLCGSKRFPSKEPFVDLLKGSLKTFLNAMTAPDKTMYPVASQSASRGSSTSLPGFLPPRASSLHTGLTKRLSHQPLAPSQTSRTSTTLSTSTSTPA